MGCGGRGARVKEGVVVMGGDGARCGGKGPWWGRGYRIFGKKVVLGVAEGYKRLFAFMG
jgi:hypothetical protein